MTTITERVNATFASAQTAASGVYWNTVATAANEPGADLDMKALQRSMATLGLGSLHFQRDVELFARHNELRQQADPELANAAARAAQQEAEAAEALYRDAQARLAEAEQARDKARDASVRVGYQHELALAARRQQQEVALQLASRGCPEFAGLRARIAQEQRDEEERRLRAHKAARTADEMREAAERRYALDQQRAVAAPGSWIEAPFAGSVVSPELGASTSNLDLAVEVPVQQPDPVTAALDQQRAADQAADDAQPIEPGVVQAIVERAKRAAGVRRL